MKATTTAPIHNRRAAYFIGIISSTLSVNGVVGRSLSKLVGTIVPFDTHATQYSSANPSLK
jgi:hypothetical protein